MSYLPAVNTESKLWLIVEWKSSTNAHNGYHLVSTDELADNLKVEDFHTGKVVNVKTTNGILQACIVIVSADKPFLEMEIKHLREAVNQMGLTKKTANATTSKRQKKLPNGYAENDGEQSDQDLGSDWNQKSAEESSESESTSRSKPKSKKRTPRSKTCRKKIKTNRGKKDPIISANESVASVQQHKSAMHMGNMQPDPYVFQSTSNSFGGSELRPYRGLERVSTPHPGVYSQPRQSFTSTSEENFKAPPMTFDQQTQTNVSNCDGSTSALKENQRLMNNEIIYLHKTLEAMNQKINAMQMLIDQLQSNNPNRYENVQNGTSAAEVTYVHSESYIMPNEEVNNSMVLRESNRINVQEDVKTMNYSLPSTSSSSPTDMPVRKHGYITKSNLKRKKAGSANNSSNTSSNNNGSTDEADENDMMPIGSGKTMVPRHIFNQVKWTSYTTATRKLLMAVFPRRTLATHSLTGKSSPAFHGKPAKMQLDAKKVTDIIMTVSQLCNVPENLVRSMITTKCADENKMYRMRLAKMRNRKKGENGENKTP